MAEAMGTEDVRMTARQAMEELGGLGNLHQALERRATGLTWMVWGIAIAGLFMTYNFLGVLDGRVQTVPEALFMVAWAPWVAAGVLTTALLWRAVGLVVPVRMERREVVVGVGLFIVLLPAAIFLTTWAGAPWVEPAVALAATGGVYLVLGAIGWACTEPVERRAWLVVGSCFVVAAVAGSLAVGGDREAAYALFSVLAPGLVLVLQLATGLLLASRA